MSTNTLIERPEQRPEVIDEILTTLKRYDVSVIKDLEDYLFDQYENGFSDLNSNLALLKLYELSDETSVERQDSTIKILVKGLIQFTSSDFTLYLHLLPPYIFSTKNEYTERIQGLVQLYELLISNKFDQFLAKNKETSLVDEKSVKLIEETFQNNKNAKFIIGEPASEEVPVNKLSKVVGQLLQN
ncbi:hypothetical protein BN7_5095 [Wickerhamomyces ciferrii]|uniref:CSN8/PSMD8/EIF3K domain-containing protein n=1 Tax=Wickerhamomyces ciferrii (strain ATCC 14091 / BCRC 22168 / CBS 111 / JCM 3599 / NBRC 0793 / NRRL Y-1031 F-60-10) TaxID=1206466 RepID=K0KWJ9_WICCF|nr:uncharacterized protein BN7_5095 [Wickerhamomyces ciferrii]CCH45513.1 hypothetical protein BN7_5095 [Wickerhamomyces ciferrii]